MSALDIMQRQLAESPDRQAASVGSLMVARANQDNLSQCFLSTTDTPSKISLRLTQIKQLNISIGTPGRRARLHIDNERRLNFTKQQLFHPVEQFGRHLRRVLVLCRPEPYPPRLVLTHLQVPGHLHDFSPWLTG